MPLVLPCATPALPSPPYSVSPIRRGRFRRPILGESFAVAFYKNGFPRRDVIHDQTSSLLPPLRPYLASKFVERKFERPGSERERRARSVGKSARAARITPGRPHPRRQTSASFDTLIHIKQQSIPDRRKERNYLFPGGKSISPLLQPETRLIQPRRETWRKALISS